jgi:hypothetical protein
MTSPEAPTAGGGHRAKIFVVEAGPAAGTVISLEEELRLGRGEHGGDLGGDIALSRHHAVLRTGPGRITIEDLGSTNGTFLNGSRISGVSQVRPGDTIEVGNSKLRLAPAPGEATGRLPQSGAGAGGSWGADPAPGRDDTGWGPAVAPAADWEMPRPPPAAHAPGPGAVARPGAVADNRGGWAGTVTGVERRSYQVGSGQGMYMNQVLAFRLQQFTESGDRRALINVEVRGKQLAGDVAVGDQVRAYGRLKDGIVRATRVDNLTTGGTIAAVSHRKVTLIQAAIFLLFMIAAATALIIFVTYEMHKTG